MKKAMILMVGLLFAGSMAYAAPGDLIVNGNIGVGTTAPTQKLDVNGNVKANGVCLGGSCTSTLHVSGGLYGYCVAYSPSGDLGCSRTLSPATCGYSPNQGAGNLCVCPAGYTIVRTGFSMDDEFNGYYAFSCYKN